MNKENLKACHSWIQDQLQGCIRFWLNNAVDTENGGVFTCLDRTGRVYSTDKSVWMQGRCGWIYAWLCHLYGKKPEWLEISKNCIDFMEKACFNERAGDRMYFTVTADGKPLRQRRYYFSEAFCAMANAEYYGQTGDRTCLDRARKEYDIYWDLSQGREDPAGIGPKTDPETRTGRSFGIPMIFLNVSSVMLRCDPERKALYEERCQWCVDTILRYHYHPELQCVLENTGPNGEARLDFTDGRIVNPGHDIEGVWFLVEQALQTGDRSLIDTAETIFHNAFQAGWDPEYGGLLYFTDCKGFPPEVCEHDMKLWWPHCEALISSLMLYRETGRESYLDIFYQVLQYCADHFADPQYGEWYGYLRRDGKPTEPSTKGTTFKGPYHMIRMLAMTEQMLRELMDRT